MSIYNTRLHLKKKVSNALEFLHPEYLRAWAAGAPAEKRRAIRKSLRYQRPTPPAEEEKWAIIRDYATRSGCQIFVETGTYRGDTLAAVSDLFREMHSVEIDDSLYQQAQRRFAGHPKFHLHHGDSAAILHEILSPYNEPILFWLDGHASGGETGSGSKHSPILEELATIMKHPNGSHIILIDDAMDFGIEPDYPPIAKLQRLTRRYAGFSIDRHIIRITPGNA